MRFVRIAAWVVAALVALAVAASFHPMVRNVYRALNPATDYDAVAPDLAVLPDPQVLVFSKTNGFRHGEAIEAGAEVLRAIASRSGWSMVHTENGAVFEPKILAGFRAVVWLNASGAPLDERQRAALRAWIEAGGGFVGLHAALDGSHAAWDWYAREVIGANFIGHALGVLPATVRVERPDHPIFQAVEPEWHRSDEWYSFDRSVRGDSGVEVLATLDESTYEPRLKMLWIDQDLAMGDHPIVWTRTVGEGRAFLSAFGHSAESFREPAHGAMLQRALEWAMRSGDGALPEESAHESAQAAP